MQAKAQILLRAGAVLVAALALCWTVLVNGQPFLHPDSLGYVRGPDVAIMKLLGSRFASPWATLDPGAAVAAHEARSAPATSHGYDDKEVLGGRSIYYGVLADLGARTGGFWLTVLVQALAVALLVEIVLRGLGVLSLRAYAGVMALLSLASPAAFFVGFVMPDIWAGVAVGALAGLFALAGRLRRLDVAALAAMTAFGALAHTSVSPVLALMMLGGAALWLFQPRQIKPALGLIVGVSALAIAAAGAFAFSAMVRHTVGATPVTPPFLSARVVADGTGARFAQSSCGGQSFVVCRYAGRLPMDVDHFLWGVTDRDGLFQTVAAPERRALGEEQFRFALAVVRAYPLQQAMASFRNASAQMGDTDLSDFIYKPSLKASFGATLPAKTLAVMQGTRAYGQAWPVDRLWAFQTGVMGALVLLMGLVALRIEPARVGEPADLNAAASQFLFLVVLGVLANGAVCGALSSINGRYEARVIWCVPLAALAWMIVRVQAARAPRPVLRLVPITSADPA
ncbi:MAG TPA: hypothetical protein VGI79_02090 [Caulobacteraceae bacterium]|jgi:hypothetical protein